MTDLVVRGRHFQEDAILDTLRACAAGFGGKPRGSRTIFADVVCLVSTRTEQRIQASVVGKSLEIYFESN